MWDNFMEDWALAKKIARAKHAGKAHSVFCGSFGCEEAGETWELSCGHEVMTESGCDHPEYCIECGTKVVTQ